jgi:hypothetical protein
MPGIRRVPGTFFGLPVEIWLPISWEVKNHLFSRVYCLQGTLSDAIFHPSQGCDGQRERIRKRPAEGTALPSTDRPSSSSLDQPDFPPDPQGWGNGRGLSEGFGLGR